jgi:hypothetical protein
MTRRLKYLTASCASYRDGNFYLSYQALICVEQEELENAGRGNHY